MTPRRPITLRTVFGAWGRILRGYSPLLSIEITRQCPLSCPGCYAYGDDHLGGGTTLAQLSDYRGDELVERTLEMIRDHKPLQVSFVGGEPLVRHRELSRILPRVSEMGVHSLVVTSAVIPFPKEWNEIPRVRVAVSVDGLQPDHDARRKPATYDKILANLNDRVADVSWVVTNQQLQQDGYLDQYLSFWTSRPNVERVWLSLYTPQMGEESEEQLTPETRQRLFQELPALKDKYPDLILYSGAEEAFEAPPSDPGSCTFARMSVNYSADLETPVEPCFFGGSPDCSQCGCAVSVGLHHFLQKPLGLGLKGRHLIEPTLAIGHRMAARRGRIRSARRLKPDSPSNQRQSLQPET